MDPYLEFPELRCPLCITGKFHPLPGPPRDCDTVQMVVLEDLLQWGHKKVEDVKIQEAVAGYLLDSRPVVRAVTCWTKQGLEIQELWLEDGTAITLTGAKIKNITYERKEEHGRPK